MTRDAPTPDRRALACPSPQGAAPVWRGERVLGVVSDTHGLLRPELLAALAGVEQIVHAGDVGAPELLARLAVVAPVVVVRGNNDTAPWAKGLRERETLTVGGTRILVLHDRKDLAAEELAALAPAVVISGHSHKPSLEERGGVLFFNPGSAGPRRFHLPVAVGKLFLRQGQARGELVRLV